ncbi:D-glycerate dehydrogenase [Rhodococcus sp. Eu-32]|uniref:2-hydroxyacid dehydrogenase n=1 Tax=Rhodococcus sp. Eu-32 TaxID=1017319 RepID=UPI000DF46D2A|nr:D-glycerate dehydrogenase [Rhodococcus sp. Eu-32]RRQ25598.1 D-glycerate dehydrogenase [Rhodococcus sp. Eu-32]
MASYASPAPDRSAQRKFFVTTPIPEPAMTMLRRSGHVDLPSGALSDTDLECACASGRYDVIVAQLNDRFDRDVLDAARIRGISNFAVGYNNIDVEHATANGVMVANTPEVLTDATADIAMLLILATARRAVEADTFMRSGQFDGWKPNLLLGHDITDRTLGLVGFGRIARATARRAVAFGMNVIFCARPSTERPTDTRDLADLAGSVRSVGWDELVTTSDFLSVHVPLNEQTHHLVNAAVLNAMKPSSILINTARGPIVDETALVSALESKAIAAAGLDVYEDEPRMATGLAQLPNTVLLPHIGSATVSVRAEMARLCALNAIAIAAGTIPPHAVNPQAWDL